MIKPPFKIFADAPAPLCSQIIREVRFDEVDMMGIVWHGRYVNYLEEARVALGNFYKMGYMDFYHNAIAVPLKKMEIDYTLPLRFQDTFAVNILWHWSPSARINMEYILKNSSGEIVTHAYTVQLFINLDGSHMLYPPDFYQDFLDKWKLGNV